MHEGHKCSSLSITLLSSLHSHLVSTFSQSRVHNFINYHHRYPEIRFEPFIRSFHCPRCVGKCKCPHCCTQRGVPYIRATRRQLRNTEVDLFLSEQATQRLSRYGKPDAPRKKKIALRDDDAAYFDKSSSSSKTRLVTRVTSFDRVYIGDWQPCWGSTPARFRDVDPDQKTPSVLSSADKGKEKESNITPDQVSRRMYIGAPLPRSTKQVKANEPIELPPPMPPARTPRKAPPNAVNARLISAEERASMTMMPSRTKRTRKPSQKAIEAAKSAAVLDALDNDSQDAEGTDHDGERCRKRPRSLTHSSGVASRFTMDNMEPSPDDFTIPEPEQRSSQKTAVACPPGYPYDLGYDWSQITAIFKSISYYTPTPTPDDLVVDPISSNPNLFTDVTYSSTYASSLSPTENYQMNLEPDSTSPPTSGASTPTSRLPIKKHSLAAKDVNVGLFAPFAVDMLDTPMSLAGPIDAIDPTSTKTLEFRVLGTLQPEDVERAVRAALSALSISCSPTTV